VTATTHEGLTSLNAATETASTDAAPVVRAVLYSRISKDTEGFGLGVERQREELHRLAAARGWHVVADLADNDISASSGKRRPAYEQAMALVDRREVDVLAVWAVDRLVRRLRDLEDVIDRTEAGGSAAGVRIVTCQGDLDLSSPAGRMQARILASVARNESEQKGLRQRLQQRQAAQSGRPPARRAFGYLPGGRDLNEPEAEAIRECVARLLAGASLTSLADYLNGLGLTTSLGRPWERTAVRAMLLNARLAGIRTLRGEVVGKGAWPPVLPEEDWHAVRALLLTPGRTTSGGTTARKWVGGSLYRCGRCGAPMRTGTRGGASGNASADAARIYLCDATGPKHLTRRADEVDAYVLGVTEARLAEPDMAALLPVESPDVAGLRREAADLRERRDGLGEAFADGLLTAAQVKTASDRLAGRLAEVEERLAQASQAGGLSYVLAAECPPVAFRSAALGIQRAVIDTLMTVVLLPGRSGSSGFDPATVRLDWRG
jgi:DNA invertase Pin-like site-specific DNA recombinase